MSIINLSSQRELFIDRYLIDKFNGTFLKLHEPYPMEKSIIIDKPWEGAGNAGNGVICLDGKYLMYYRALDPSDPNDMGKSCVAFSDDGIHWTKPALQPEGTNYVLTEDGQFISGFLDTRPGVPKNERVKGFLAKTRSGIPHTVFNDPGGVKYLEFYSSEDGLTFRRMDTQPTLEVNMFNGLDGGNSMSWSEAEQQYVFYFRYSVIQPTDHGSFSMRRSVARMTSKDFYNWSTPEEMRCSRTPEQFYVNNTFPYHRAPQIYISLAARFMERRRVLSDEQAQELPLVPEAALEAQFAGTDPSNINAWLHAALVGDCSDGVLLSTRAGSAVYDRTFMEAYVRPGLGYSNWVTRTNYPFSGVFQIDENTMSFYVWRDYMQTTWYVQRMALRTDGFASLSAPWDGGCAITKPFTYTGNILEINYRTSAAGYIRVELTDEDGNILPGFAAQTCEEIIGDEISRQVRWASGYPLSRWENKPVRLRFIMKDADIFSFRFFNT